MPATHAIVIGAGVIGSSLAFRLAQGGARVTLVDRSGPAHGTTGTSFAWINSNTKEPEDYFGLNVAGMQAHRELRDELGEAPWLSEGGNLNWVTGAENESELEARVARLRSWNYPAEWLDRAAMQELEPNVLIEPEVEQGALFPTEAWIDGPRLAARMTELAADHGAELRFASQVTAIDRSDAGLNGVVLANGERITGDLVVNCAGPGADKVARLVGRTLPLAPTVGFIVRISGVSGVINRVIHAPRVHMRPDGGGLVMLHHYDADSAMERGEDPVQWANELIERARSYVPEFANARLSRWSITTRPIPEDDRTSAGVLSGIPGYGEVVTHSGITLGPLLGRLVAREILTGEVDPLLLPFRPDRF